MLYTICVFAFTFITLLSLSRYKDIIRKELSVFVVCAGVLREDCTDSSMVWFILVLI